MSMATTAEEDQIPSWYKQCLVVFIWILTSVCSDRLRHHLLQLLPEVDFPQASACNFQSASPLLQSEARRSSRPLMKNPLLPVSLVGDPLALGPLLHVLERLLLVWFAPMQARERSVTSGICQGL
jgi:hypothetical protein